MGYGEMLSGLVLICGLLIFGIYVSVATSNLVTTRTKTNTPTSTSSSSNSSATCNKTLNNTDSSPWAGATVYQAISSYAVLCLTYAAGRHGNMSFSNFQIYSWAQNGSELQSSGVPCSVISSEYECPNFTITPSPLKADFHNATQKVNVTLSINSAPNATGLYILFLTLCDPIYLSFGQAPKTVFLMALSCGPVPPPGDLIPRYNITGETNVKVISAPWR